MLLGLLHLFFVVAIIDSRPLSGPITNSSNDILPLMEFRTISHVLKTCNENEVMNARGNCVPLVKVTSEVKLDLFAIFGFQPDASTEASCVTTKESIVADMSSKVSTTLKSDLILVTEPPADLQDSTDEVFDSTTEATFETTTEPFEDITESVTESNMQYFFEARTLPPFII